MLLLDLLVATGIALAVYLLNGAFVRRALSRDRRHDDPLRRAYAVEIAAVGQVAGAGHAVGAGVGAFLSLQVPSVFGACLVVVLGFAVFGVPVSRWEARRRREIRA